MKYQELRTLETASSEGGDTSRDDRVRELTIEWKAYVDMNLLTMDEMGLLLDYDKQPERVQEKQLKEHGKEYATILLKLLCNVTNEMNLSYILRLTEDMVVDYPTSLSYFHACHDSGPDIAPFEVFLRLLNRNDTYVKVMASHFVTRLFATSPMPFSHQHAQDFVRWISDVLSPSVVQEWSSSVVGDLQQLLRISSFRLLGFQNRLVHSLVNLLRSLTRPIKNMQLVYQVLFCLWLISFHKGVVVDMTADNDLIRVVVDAVRAVENTKVIRVSLALLRNLLGFSNNNEMMIASGILRLLESFERRKWDDEDIEQDLEVLQEQLGEDLRELNSFDRYRQEVLHGQIMWSSVHTSEMFWRENIHRFEENDFEVIRRLADIVLHSEDPIALAVVCHDLGEFGRLHHAGKKIIESLEVKPAIMTLIMNPDPEVQKHALLCVQKMMVTQWQFIGS